jgi:flagellar basal-body rod protein FlgC
MPIFGAMHTAASGMNVFRTWLDATADNLSNTQSINLTPGGQPFSPHRVIVTANGGVDDTQNHGARVVRIDKGDETARPLYDPQLPLADPVTGEVKYPGVDMGVEMVNMVAAQRGYQANLQTFQTAKDAYQAALRLGR